MTKATVAGAVVGTAAVGGGLLYLAYTQGWLKGIGIGSPAEQAAANAALQAQRRATAQAKARAATVTPRSGNQEVIHELSQ